MASCGREGQPRDWLRCGLQKLPSFSSGSPPAQSGLSLEAAVRGAHSISGFKLSLSKEAASPGPFLPASLAWGYRTPPPALQS